MQPSYRQSRREALVAVLLWLLAGAWTVGVSYWLGYDRPPNAVGGIPDWVLWGIFVPWLVFFLLHCWYSLFYLRDEDEPPPPSPPRREGG